MQSPFLTDLDPTLRVQGSRDPLGVQAVWSAFGRPLVGNLTLTSGDVAGFRTLLVGYHLAAAAAGPERQAAFLRWEQLAAACRTAGGDTVPPLGALRVRSWLAQSPRYELSALRRQILGDQPGTGLWSLYHRPSLSSGLVTRQRTLTEHGRACVEALLPRLPRSWLAKALEEGSAVLLSGAGADRAAAVAELLRHGVQDREVLRSALLDNTLDPQQAAPLQATVAQLLRRHAHEDHGWRQRVALLRQDALATGTALGAQVAQRVEAVQVVESFLAPLQAAFDSLLEELDGMTVGEAAAVVTAAWPHTPKTVRAQEARLLQGELTRAVGTRRALAWLQAAEAAARGDWASAFHSLVEVNELTMAARGGAPWVRVTDGRLRVDMRKGAPLQPEEDLLSGWRNPYFLPPLRTLQRDLDDVARAA